MQTLSNPMASGLDITPLVGDLGAVTDSAGTTASTSAEPAVCFCGCIIPCVVTTPDE